MDINSSQPQRRSRARERVAARQARQSAVPRVDMVSESSARIETDSTAAVPVPRASRWVRRRIPDTANVRERITLRVKDAWWYTLHRPYVLRGVGVALVALFLVFVLGHIFTGRIFPNVWTMGVPLGDLTLQDAEIALQTAWANDVKIALQDADRRWLVSPGEIGLQLDAAATVANARGVGMAGLPMGYSVIPVVSVDLFTAQDYLLNLTEEANFAPYNAGYQWEGDRLTGVMGRDGRVLDVGQTMENLRLSPSAVADRQVLELAMSPLPPDVVDPLPYLEQARVIAEQNFTLTGYDPFRDEHVSWSTDRETFTSWIEAGIDGLSLREDVFASFLEAQNASLNTSDANGVRFLEPLETTERIEASMREGIPTADLRIRYRGSQYEVVSGDTGYRIARKTGIPFYLLTNANPGLEWESLSVGQTVSLPSRDLALPLAPVPNKRIVVNLDAQTLVAFEDGQQVFNWLISTGTDQFPTYPGVYQVLSHEEEALGSTFELCGASGCGQWRMYWFMGIYEVVPGLMNGFHGAVLLPNGAYLGGGNVGAPYTYGCVMSENSNAEQLYRWADAGTVVEIISSDYAPQSELGRLATSQAAAVTS